MYQNLPFQAIFTLQNMLFLVLGNHTFWANINQRGKICYIFLNPGSRNLVYLGWCMPPRSKDSPSNGSIEGFLSRVFFFLLLRHLQPFPNAYLALHLRPCKTCSQILRPYLSSHLYIWLSGRTRLNGLPYPFLGQYSSCLSVWKALSPVFSY